jgi:hypothetical protein
MLLPILRMTRMMSTTSRHRSVLSTSNKHKIMSGLSPSAVPTECFENVSCPGAYQLHLQPSNFGSYQERDLSARVSC